MLFNSYTFIFAFLPITFCGFWILTTKASRRVAIGWLVFCSLFFYGWWQPRNLWLLVFLLLFNYALGVWLGKIPRPRQSKLILIFGLSVNLGLLGYYKYANFFVDVVNDLAETHLQIARIALPLGISFFIFQKIAYLVDAYRKQVRGYSLVDYSLFVTFFPQLIAGPIVHHSEVVPQFSRQQGARFSFADINVGLTQFICGLFKKVAVADRIALLATPVFDAAQNGFSPTLIDGWIAALAYAFQIYFDFSGYSDMALGLARIFGIRLPQNFNSPYKAANITEFWRSWHMTLSRFLRDYLYIPLGGNRKGPTRRYINLMITMLLGGLWHGAGWTFVIWGGLHGVYLAIHRGWRAFRQRSGRGQTNGAAWKSLVGRFVTFAAVVMAWVLFRSANLATAGRILSSMVGGRGLDLSSTMRLPVPLFTLGSIWVAVWLLPNTQEFVDRFEPALNYKPPAGRIRPHWISWRPNLSWSICFATVAVYALSQTSHISEFIYWQF
jgi:alginate O-acetyltransferase complex protein AlgI